MAEQDREFYLWGDQLDVTDNTYGPVLQDGQVMRGVLEERGGMSFIFISSGVGNGGTLFPVTRAVGRDGVEEALRKYEQEQREIEEREGENSSLLRNWQSSRSEYGE